MSRLTNPAVITELRNPKPPACFDSGEQWDSYREMALMAKPHSGGFCQDCTLRHQTNMIQAGRCEYPTAKFRRFGESVIGIRIEYRRSRAA